jgi:monomeric isocitrate dehydrogenase
MGSKTGNEKATLLGDSLMEAVGLWLENNKGPGRKAKEIDNRLVLLASGNLVQRARQKGQRNQQQVSIGNSSLSD